MKKCLIFIIFISSSLVSGMNEPILVDQNNLNYNIEKYGCKYANLVEAEKLCTEISPKIEKNTGYTISVPPFFGIESEAVLKFLKSENIDVKKYWGGLIKDKTFENLQEDLIHWDNAVVWNYDLEKDINNILNKLGPEALGDILQFDTSSLILSLSTLSEKLETSYKEKTPLNKKFDNLKTTINELKKIITKHNFDRIEKIKSIEKRNNEFSYSIKDDDLQKYKKELHNYLELKKSITNEKATLYNLFSKINYAFSSTQVYEKNKTFYNVVQENRIEKICKIFETNYPKDFDNTIPIVRSSSIVEDRDDISNAGGNKSIPVTQSTPYNFYEAVKKVTSSYCGKQSIQQRIYAKDPSLLDEKTIVMPLLLQEIKGEPLISYREFLRNLDINIRREINLTRSWSDFQKLFVDLSEEVVKKAFIQFLYDVYEKFRTQSNTIYNDFEKKSIFWKKMLTANNENDSDFNDPRPLYGSSAYFDNPNASVLNERYYSFFDIFRCIVNGKFYQLAQDFLLDPNKRHRSEKWYELDRDRQNTMQEKFIFMFDEFLIWFKKAIKQEQSVQGNVSFRGFVMFSADPSVEKNKRSPVIVQSCYGSNVAITDPITGDIKVDTFYMLKNFVYPILSEKKKRLVLSQVGDFIKIDNPKSAINLPSLSSESLKALYLLADELQKSNGKPVDIEGVVDEENKTIYIVQVRPIVYRDQEEKPTYFADITQIENENKIKGIIASRTTNSLIEITQKEQILVAKDDGEALKIYNNPSTNRNSIKIIFVKKIPLLLSHAAVILRGEGKVLCCLENDNIKKINDWIKKNRVFIDVQQEWILNLGNIEDSIDQLISKKIVNIGLFSYPMLKQLSMNFVDKKYFEDNYGKDFKITLFGKSELNEKKLQEYNDFFQAHKNKNLMYFLNELKKIKPTNRERGIFLLKILFDVVKSQVKKYKKDVNNDEDFLSRLSCFLKYFFEIVTSLKGLIDEDESSNLYMAKLFYLRLLESLFSQDSRNIIDGYSLGTLTKEIKEEVEIRKNSKEKLDHNITQLIRLKKYALSKKVETNYNIFLESLSEKEITNLTEIMLRIGKLNILPLWLNLKFSEEIDQYDEIINEFTKAAKIISNLKIIRNELQNINVQNFEDPQKFDVSWQKFLNSPVKKIKQSLSTILNEKDKNLLIKMVGLDILELLVDKFDTIIKTMKASTKYKIIEDEKDNEHLKTINKLYTFKIMVKEFLKLLLFDLLTFSNQFFEYQKRGIFSMYPYTYISYLIEEELLSSDLIKKFFTGSPLENEKKERQKESYDGYRRDNYESQLYDITNKSCLEPSSDQFNVSAAAIGSSTEWFRSNPKNLEDLFTFTHQSLINLLSSMQNYYLKIKKIIKTNTFFQTLIEKFERINKINDQGRLDEGQAIVFRSCTITKESVSFHYNWPLRNHSATLSLLYNKKSPKFANVEVCFFGFNSFTFNTNIFEEKDGYKGTDVPKWENLISIATTIFKREQIHIINTDYNNSSATITSKIEDDQKKIDNLIKIIINLVKFTLG
jgi:hypothetical protein